MLSTIAASFIFAQLALPVTLEQDRLTACMDEAQRDPATAIATANEWLEGTSGPGRSLPQQCLGIAYTALLRWDAAMQAFTTARDARLVDDYLARARLGGMAGNAALAGEVYLQATSLLLRAEEDALAAEQNVMAGQFATDRARALVALGLESEAAAALAKAREFAPQDATIWLLSATLARRMDDLANAQDWIETASLLDSVNPSIGLEAGLIAALAGFEDAARASWQSVVDNAGGSPQASTAQLYLQQLDEAPVQE
jgi:tetratricopeptide (TPR) repeat protein